MRPSRGQRHPVLVMGHGFSGVKEMLEPHANYFCGRGFAVVAFDYPFLAASEGEPRSQILTAEQIADYRNAITFVSLQLDVDAERIGIWGTSMSGGHVNCVGALDRRAKCVACQVPLIEGSALVPPDFREAMLSEVAADRLERYHTGAVNYMPIVAEDGQSCFFKDNQSYEVLMTVKNLVAPNRENRVTMEPIEKTLEYSPGLYLLRLSPTPLMMIVAEHDTLTPHEVPVSAYSTALEPKKLEILPCGHFEAYTDGFDQAVGAAADWFVSHLTWSPYLWPILAAK